MVLGAPLRSPLGHTDLPWAWTRRCPSPTVYFLEVGGVGRGELQAGSPALQHTWVLCGMRVPRSDPWVGQQSGFPRPSRDAGGAPGLEVGHGHPPVPPARRWVYGGT